jgi:hypothetical protein
MGFFLKMGFSFRKRKSTMQKKTKTAMVEKLYMTMQKKTKTAMVENGFFF